MRIDKSGEDKDVFLVRTCEGCFDYGYILWKFIVFLGPKGWKFFRMFTLVPI